MATIPRWRQWMGLAGINAIIDFINQNTSSVGTLSTSKVDGAASSTDNAIARFNGTGGKTIQNSTPIVQDDGRISTVTDPTSAQDAATKAYVDANAAGITQLTGDVTAGPGSGSQAATLATSGVSAGTYGDATHVPQFTVDVKGRITSVSDVAISGGGGGGTGDDTLAVAFAVGL